MPTNIRGQLPISLKKNYLCLNASTYDNADHSEELKKNQVSLVFKAKQMQTR